MKLTLPNYILKMPDDAQLCTNDLVSLFGVNCSRSVTKEVERGNIPKPDNISLNRFKKPRFNWSVGYLKQFNGQEFNVAKRYKK